jgi:hypothetical protein
MNGRDEPGLTLVCGYDGRATVFDGGAVGYFALADNTCMRCRFAMA